ncbi:hypothetical protein DVA67_017660 [Solirubrobacter sp. CPCC 204708]|uniref:Chromosome partitioning protein ParB n=1 Tax=Solirubrobacter deserti TaxID=2282478 RepID=A0ABT4RCY9_9ACTN|nr:hypothetical protein [Solirubrobacter deserti]MBE2317813.1 hypothetical protein [Solirubrobacter deserti]MDA0136410.1 hypothetical protein [Solirubrobacter deserti]
MPGDGPTIKQLVGRPIGDLLLDPKNPRLPLDLDGDDQFALIQFFDKRYDLDELAESMLEKGFFPQEPLLVLKPDYMSNEDAEGPQHDGHARVVVEGNRRLATLKLLLDEDAQNHVERSAHWRGLRERAEAVRDRLEIVPTQQYAERGEVEDYLGFRHVTGIEQWTAEAKARFVTEMVAGGASFKDAARKIGSRQDAVRRQVITYASLRQAQDDGQDVERAVRFFGVFYRALQTQGIREFVGVPDYREFDAYDPAPVPPGNEPRVAELASWLFGDGAHVKPLFTDSRRLTDLGRVLRAPDAVVLLQEERDFAGALALSDTDKSSIQTSLNKARTELVRANGLAFNFVGDAEVISRARDVARVLDAIVGTLGEPRADSVETSPATGTVEKDSAASGAPKT